MTMGPVDLTQQSFVELCCAGEDISALMCLSNSGYYKKKDIDILLKKVTGDIQMKKILFLLY